VTGTNGKTSVSWWLAQALTALGQRCGVVGTLGLGAPPDLESTGLTTPDPVSLQRAFRRFLDQGFGACAIEASSIGIEEHRLAGTRVDVALFTNFTQDHLDYHGSMEAYWQAKARLFAWPGLKAAVLNLDDLHGALLEQALAGTAVTCWTVARHVPARLRASEPVYADGGLCFDVVEGDERVSLATSLIGDFNLSNLLVVLGGLRALGLPLADAARACSALQPVPGRMQRLGGGAAQPLAVVDYAHTPDALDKALCALQPLVDARGGVLWCLFGCGGNRDAGKRPLMAALAEQHAGRVVLTSDNPRGESPAAILADLRAGLQAPDLALVIEDRREAIDCALRDAAPADVVLIAGKGHEDYQEIAGVRRPFSDLAVAQQALAARAGARVTGSVA
jgi:UDP-N-acetylmuramoyl-L-alanyl-D-glutamate--2,6-diaminopimelate ligase